MRTIKSSIFITVFFITIITVLIWSLISKGKYFSNSEPDEESFAPESDWFERQRAYPFTEIPDGEYVKSIEYSKQNIPVRNSINSGWTLAGPINIEGRITVVAIHPTNPQIVYAGCANGGVWKSTNFCTSWVSVFDNQTTSSIGALAINPTNPQEIYCGTGEDNSLRSYYPGTGMYKSTDGGNTWQLVGLQNTYSIGRVVINPSNTQEVYAAAVGALRRTNIER